MILASPGVARTPLLADFRARLGSFSARIFRRLFKRRPESILDDSRPHLRPQTDPKTAPNRAGLLRKTAGAAAQRGDARAWVVLKPARAASGPSSPPFGPFWGASPALVGAFWAVFGPFWQSLTSCCGR